MDWVVFSYSLPTKLVSSPRVTLWRRLRRLGSLALAGGAQVLPARDECVEAFQWLAQEIRQARGEANVMRVAQFEGLTDQQLIAMFHAAREEDYAEIEARAIELEKLLTKRARPDDRKRAREALDVLRRRHAEIRRVDYFDSPAGVNVAARLARIEQALSPKALLAANVQTVAVAEYRNRQWMTRPHPHVDRLACIWLIRRFIDPAAVVRYGLRPKSNEVAFDMDAAEFGHTGILCTFETMRLAFRFDDPALRAIAEIVHEIDLRDGRSVRPEIAGVDAILNGWLLTGMTDAELEAHGVALFEGLYAALSPGPAANA